MMLDEQRRQGEELKHQGERLDLIDERSQDTTAAILWIEQQQSSFFLQFLQWNYQPSPPPPM